MSEEGVDEPGQRLEGCKDPLGSSEQQQEHRSRRDYGGHQHAVPPPQKPPPPQQQRQQRQQQQSQQQTQPQGHQHNQQQRQHKIQRKRQHQRQQHQQQEQQQQQPTHQGVQLDPPSPPIAAPPSSRWVSAVDRATGWTYHYRPSTAEVRWEKSKRKKEVPSNTSGSDPISEEPAGYSGEGVPISEEPAGYSGEGVSWEPPKEDAFPSPPIIHKKKSGLHPPRPEQPSTENPQDNNRREKSSAGFMKNRKGDKAQLFSEQRSELSSKRRTRELSKPAKGAFISHPEAVKASNFFLAFRDLADALSEQDCSFLAQEFSIFTHHQLDFFLSCAMREKPVVIDGAPTRDSIYAKLKASSFLRKKTVGGIVSGANVDYVLLKWREKLNQGRAKQAPKAKDMFHFSGAISCLLSRAMLNFLASFQITTVFSFLSHRQGESGLLCEWMLEWRKKCGLGTNVDRATVVKYLHTIRSRLKWAISACPPADEKTRKQWSDPLASMRGTVKEFLADQRLTGEEFLVLPNKLLIGKLTDWRERVGMDPLKGSGPNAVVCMWKAAVREITDLDRSAGRILKLDNMMEDFWGNREKEPEDESPATKARRDAGESKSPHTDEHSSSDKAEVGVKQNEVPEANMEAASFCADLKQISRAHVKPWLKTSLEPDATNESKKLPAKRGRKRKKPFVEKLAARTPVKKLATRTPDQSLPLSSLPQDPLPSLPQDPLPSLPQDPLPSLPQDPLAFVPQDPLPLASVPKDPLPLASVPKDPLPLASVPKDPLPLASVPQDPLASVPQDPLPLASVPKDPVPLASLPLQPNEKVRRLIVTYAGNRSKFYDLVADRILLSSPDDDVVSVDDEEIETDDSPLDMGVGHTLEYVVEKVTAEIAASLEVWPSCESVARKREFFAPLAKLKQITQNVIMPTFVKLDLPEREPSSALSIVFGTLLMFSEYLRRVGSSCPDDEEDIVVTTLVGAVAVHALEKLCGGKSSLTAEFMKAWESFQDGDDFETVLGAHRSPDVMIAETEMSV